MFIDVNGLTKTYRQGPNVVEALSDVSFQVQKGSFVVILGSSGSGKSTLLHMMAGVDRPTEGTITIDGTSILALDESRMAIFRRRHIGLIYQFYNLLPVLTVEENITLPQLLDRQPVDRARLDSLLEILGLRDRRQALPGELSGGQQQRVSIGRALFNRPAIVLADEPTGNLDSRTGRQIVDLLRLSNAEWNQTILMVTHNESIASAADRVLVLEDGRIAEDAVYR